MVPPRVAAVFLSVRLAPLDLTTQALGLAPVLRVSCVELGLSRTPAALPFVVFAQRGQPLVFWGPPLPLCAPNVKLVPSPPSLGSFFVAHTAPRAPSV